MTAQDIINKVRDKLGDTEFDQQQIIDAANWFTNDLFSNNATAMMEKSATLSPLANATSVTLPADYQTVIWEGLNITSPQIYNLKKWFKSYGDFMQLFPGFATYTARNLAWWCFFGNTMRFSAPLLANTTIAIDYIRVPSIMVLLTDICEVPDQYEEMVVLGALARCMQTNEDYPEASQELANLAPLRTTFIANESRGQQKTGPVVMRSNRQGGNIRENGWGN